jgi:hypothetical protein
MHEGKWPLHTSLFYQAPTDLYQRTISAAAPSGLMTTTLIARLRPERRRPTVC